MSSGSTSNLVQSLRTVGQCAFSGCASLVRIDIPSSVTDFGRAAFLNLSSLRVVNLRERTRWMHGPRANRYSIECN